MDDKLTEIVTKLEQKLTDVGPEVWDTLLWVRRLEGVQDILLGLVFLIISPIVIYYCAPKVKEAYEYRTTEYEVFWGSIGAAVVAFFFVMFIAGVVNLLNLWNWVAIFDPELAIAHDVLNQLLSK